jgi:hypothetical protein
MKRKDAWLWILSAILVGASLTTYLVHYLIFRDLRHIVFYTLMDIGFLFLNVLLVVLLLERLLAQREKRSKLDKLNMVIGAFFSEVGLELLKRSSTLAANAAELEGRVRIVPQWGRKDFSRAAEAARTFAYEIIPDREKLADLGGFLSAKRDFLVGLLENPSLLEHESFTDLLWAVFHLAEELSFRNTLFGELPESDLQHLGGDLKRAYSQMTAIWIDHVRHLKESYPFLFSLAARINPLNPDASVIVR